MYTRKTPKTIANTTSHTLYILMEAASGHSTPAKRGVNIIIVGCTDSSNSDNQNGDSGGVASACARVCVCMRACVRDVFAIYDNIIFAQADNDNN